MNSLTVSLLIYTSLATLIVSRIFFVIIIIWSRFRIFLCRDSVFSRRIFFNVIELANIKKRYCETRVDWIIHFDCAAYKMVIVSKLKYRIGTRYPISMILVKNSAQIEPFRDQSSLIILKAICSSRVHNSTVAPKLENQVISVQVFTDSY